ncbi:MAG TPA: delta-60 repeat domain-containing protein [Devosia sp.]|nr:delta-60 repeat domain-containing protein [Devosia sp.]
MLTRSLLTLGAVLMASTALAQDITPAADFVTDKANDFRGLAYGADGKIYVSGHKGDPSAETGAQTVVVVGRLNADGTPDTAFGEDGFAEVDLGAGLVEQSLAVAPLANGDVVAAVNANEEGGGVSVYLVRFDATGKQVTGAWGGETGALEVVFGWPNANNDAFPDAEKPPQDTAWDLKVDNSSGTEKLVVAGHGSAAEGSGRTDADRYVVRLNAADGTADAGFNGGKPFTYHSAQAFAEGGRRVSVEADGAIMSAGYTNLGDGLRNHLILIRLNADGSLDQSFGGFVSPQSSADAVGLAATPGIAVFNPLLADGGFAEGYAAVRLSDGSYVTTGYGGATGEGVASTLGFKTTEAPDVVSFKVKGNALDTTYGTNGSAVVQSEGLGLTTAEDRGRLVVALPGDRTMHVGFFGGIPSAIVLDASGKLDTTVSEDGILALPNDTVASQFFGAAVSPDGKQVALSTNNNKAGARVVLLNL